jgi:hypothetical protein
MAICAVCLIKFLPCVVNCALSNRYRWSFPNILAVHQMTVSEIWLQMRFTCSSPRMRIQKLDLILAINPKITDQCQKMRRKQSDFSFFSPESIHCFLMLNPSPCTNKITKNWLKTVNRKRGKRSTIHGGLIYNSKSNPSRFDRFFCSTMM